MSARNALVPFLALTLALLAGCGSGSPVAPPQPPPSGGFNNSNLKGTYVFSVSGTDTNGLPYAIVGAFTANGQGGNGKGGITGGTLDINSGSFAESQPAIPPVIDASIHSNSFYNVNVDGRGQATLGTSTPFGNVTLDFVLTSSSHGLVTEYDNNGSGSGTLDLQASGLTQASLAGPYALSFSGLDGNASAILATVGAFTLDSSGNILAGGVEDFNDGNIAYPPAQPSGFVILGPTSTPATTIQTSSFTLAFDVYAIDSTHLKFIEMDSTPILAGDAFSQPTATIPKGSLAFTMIGSTNATPILAIGGFMVTDGAGNITQSSTEDINNEGSATAAVPFSAQYTSTGSGRFVLNGFTSGLFGGPTPQFAAYPSSGGLLMLETDNAGILEGAAYPPQSSTSFTPPQGYGLNLSGINVPASQSAGTGVEVDDIAEFSTTTTTCNNNSATFCGLTDENSAPPAGPTAPGPFDGTYIAPDSNGRGALGTTTTNNTLNGGVILTFYSVDGFTFPFIESDSTQVSTGVFVLQNSADPSSASARPAMFVPRPLVRPHGALRKQK